MKIIEQSYEILNISHENPLESIEQYGRICYQSEPKGEPEKFVKMLIDRGHHSVLEHVSITVKFITDRGVTHELVRHRLAAYSQESTRYCNYKKNIEFIRPVWFNKYEDSSAEEIWEDHIMEGAVRYQNMLDLGWGPEQARTILPNSLKTEIVMTANMREWRHIFKLRISKKAHSQIRALMLGLLDDFKEKIPVLFDDIGKE